MNTKHVARLALLTTIALILFTVEAQLPPLVPIPDEINRRIRSFLEIIYNSLFSFHFFS